MSWLEIIHVRLASPELVGVLEDLCRARDNVRVYHHATLDNDVAIHLRHHGKPTGPSKLGTQLAAAVEELGMVDHSLWMESAPAVVYE